MSNQQSNKSNEGFSRFRITLPHLSQLDQMTLQQTRRTAGLSAESRLLPAGRSVVILLALVLLFVGSACGPERSNEASSDIERTTRIALAYQDDKDLQAARSALAELDVANTNQWLLLVTETSISSGDQQASTALTALAFDMGIRSPVLERYAAQQGLAQPEAAQQESPATEQAEEQPQATEAESIQNQVADVLADPEAPSESGVESDAGAVSEPGEVEANAPDSATDQSATEEPVTEESVIEEPATEAPTVAESTSEQPAVDVEPSESLEDESTEAEPVEDDTVGEEPADQEPAPTDTPLPEPTEAVAAAQVEIVTPMNVRAGPSTVHPIIDTLQAGNSATILAKNAAGDWWHIELSGESTGWIYGPLVETSGDVDAIAIADVVPTAPPPTPTPIPQPTATPEPAPVEEQPVEEQPVDEQPVDEQPVDEQPAEDPAEPAGGYSVTTRLRPVGQDAQSCTGGDHNIFVQVVDAAGSPINGVRVKEVYTGQVKETGQKGPGTVEYDIYRGGGGQVQLVDEGGNPISPTSRGMSADWPPFDLMRDAGYCNCKPHPDENACRADLENHAYLFAVGHYVYEVTFTRN